MVPLALLRIEPKIGRVGLQISTAHGPLEAEFPAAAWMCVISFADALVFRGVADHAGAAANVHLRPARKVELVADLSVRLRMPGKLCILWVKCRRLDRVRAAGLESGRVGAVIVRGVAAALVLQAEWVLRQVCRPPFVRLEFWLDARRIAAAGGLVAECAGAAVVICHIRANPLASDRVRRQCQRKVCPVLAAAVVAEVGFASLVRPQADAVRKTFWLVVCSDKLCAVQLQGCEGGECLYRNRDDVVVPENPPRAHTNTRARTVPRSRHQFCEIIPHQPFGLQVLRQWHKKESGGGRVSSLRVAHGMRWETAHPSCSITSRVAPAKSPAGTGTGTQTQNSATALSAAAAKHPGKHSTLHARACLAPVGFSCPPRGRDVRALTGPDCCDLVRV